MNQERLMNILVGPHVSEKSTLVGERHNQVVFRVVRDARKDEIQRAVETLFDVNVTGVRVVNTKGKRKRFGVIHGRRPDWKKAYVTLQPGQDIDLLGTE